MKLVWTFIGCLFALGIFSDHDKLLWAAAQSGYWPVPWQSVAALLLCFVALPWSIARIRISTRRQRSFNTKGTKGGKFPEPCHKCGQDSYVKYHLCSDPRSSATPFCRSCADSLFKSNAAAAKSFLFLILFVSFVLKSEAASTTLIKCSITVTSPPVTGNSLTINGQTRQWTNAQTSATFLTNLAGINQSKTNLYNQIAGNPFISPSLLVRDFSASNIYLLGTAISASSVGTWCSIVLSTNSGETNLITVEVPFDRLDPTNRTNNASQLVYGMGNYASNWFATNAYALSNFMSIGVPAGGGIQTVRQPKVFDLISGNMGWMTNGTTYLQRLEQSFITNAQSVATTNLTADTARLGGTILGQLFLAYPYITNPAVAGTLLIDTNPSGSAASIAFNHQWSLNARGDGTVDLTDDDIGLTLVQWSGPGGTIFIEPTTVSNLLNVTMGTTSDTNTFRWTSSSNSYTRGTNVWAGDISYVSFAVSTLANGNNISVAFGSNVYIRLAAGALTGSPTICGIIGGATTGGRDGQQFIAFNDTGYNVTWAQNTVDPVPANRITTQSGGDVTVPNGGWTSLLYDGNAARWKITSIYPETNFVATATNAMTSTMTNGVFVIGTGLTNIDFVAGVTGYVSGGTAKLGVTAALTTNANQFLGGPLSIKSGALVTNLITYSGSPGLTSIGLPGNGTNIFQICNSNLALCVWADSNGVFYASNLFILATNFFSRSGYETNGDVFIFAGDSLVAGPWNGTFTEIGIGREWSTYLMTLSNYYHFRAYYNLGSNNSTTAWWYWTNYSNTAKVIITNAVARGDNVYWFFQSGGNDENNTNDYKGIMALARADGARTVAFTTATNSGGVGQLFHNTNNLQIRFGYTNGLFDYLVDVDILRTNENQVMASNLHPTYEFNKSLARYINNLIVPAKTRAGAGFGYPRTAVYDWLNVETNVTAKSLIIGPGDAVYGGAGAGFACYYYTNDGLNVLYFKMQAELDPGQSGGTFGTGGARWIIGAGSTEMYYGPLISVTNDFTWLNVQSNFFAKQVTGTNFGSFGNLQAASNMWVTGTARIGLDVYVDRMAGGTAYIGTEAANPFVVGANSSYQSYWTSGGGTVFGTAFGNIGANPGANNIGVAGKLGVGTYTIAGSGIDATGSIYGASAIITNQVANPGGFTNIAAGSDPLKVFTNGSATAVMTVRNNGLVGIGTVAPSVALLEVSNTVGTSVSQLFHAGTNYTNGLTISTNGLVGIGTNTPAQALEVQGNVNISGNVTNNFTKVVSLFPGDINFLNPTTKVRAQAGNDGQLLLRSSGADWNTLQLGGNTVAFPGIGRTNGDLLILGADALFGGGDTNRLRVLGGAAAWSGPVGCVLTNSTAAYTNLNGAGTMSNLANISILGNTMTNSGDLVKAKWGGRFQIAAANTNQFQVIYGGTTLLDTGNQISSNGAWTCEMTIVRTGASSQHCEGFFEWAGAAGVPWQRTNINMEAAETCGANTSIALKGGSTRVGAHTNNFFRLYFEPGP